MRCSNRHSFGAVNRGATTYGNQPITAAASVERGGSPHGCFSRVGRRLVEHCNLKARKLVQRFLQNTGCFYPTIRHDQRLGDTCPLTLRFKQFDGAKIKLNLRDVVNKGH